MAKHIRSSTEVALQKRKPRRAHAVERNEARRLANVRLIRTMILGALATGAALYWLGDQYGIEPEVMKDYFLSAVAFVAGLAVLGLLGTGILLGFKRLSRDRGRNDPS